MFFEWDELPKDAQDAYKRQQRQTELKVRKPC